jgi:hypothetical protein
MIRRVCIIALGALTLASSGFAAEKKSGIYGKPSEALAVEAVNNYAKCIVEYGSDGPRAVLAMDYRTAEYRKKLKAIGKGHDYCLTPGAQLGSNQILVAGGLAEALLARDKRLSNLERYVAFDSSKASIVSRGLTETVAFCVVRAAPGKVANIFATVPASEDENKAMQAIGQQIIGCVPAGQTMKLNRPALRALLALAAYRLAAWNAGEIAA